MMMVDTGSPKNRDPFEPFLYWSLLLGVAVILLYGMRECVERLSF